MKNDDMILGHAASYPAPAIFNKNSYLKFNKKGLNNMKIDEKFDHLMIDIETLGKTSDSIILSIGAVCFNIVNGVVGPEFECYPNVENQMDKRKIQWSTIKWWFNQNEKIRNEQSNAIRIDIRQCLIDFDFFCKSYLNEGFKLWSNGFDHAMLYHIFDQYFIETPWSYKNQFDIRSIIWMSKISVKNYESEGIDHNTINDCKKQIRFLVDAYKILKDY